MPINTLRRAEWLLGVGQRVSAFVSFSSQSFRRVQALVALFYNRLKRQTPRRFAMAISRPVRKIVIHSRQHVDLCLKRQPPRAGHACALPSLQAIQEAQSRFCGITTTLESPQAPTTKKQPHVRVLKPPHHTTVPPRHGRFASGASSCARLRCRRFQRRSRHPRCRRRRRHSTGARLPRPPHRRLLLLRRSILSSHLATTWCLSTSCSPRASAVAWD